MKKVFLLGFILIGLVISSYGQFGLRAGLNFSNLKFDDIVTDEYTISELKDRKAGFHAGVFARASLFGVYIQPELLFNTATNTFELVDLNTQEKQVLEQKFNKLSIPVVAGKKFGPFRAGLGPVATILISDKSELVDYTNYEEKFKSATFGYQLDLGLDISDISIDFKFEGNLSKFGDGIMVGGEKREFDSRESQFILSLGYLF